MGYAINLTCQLHLLSPLFYSVVIAHKMNPRLPAGKHDLDLSNITYDYKFDVSKGQKIFGIKLRTKEEDLSPGSRSESLDRGNWSRFHMKARGPVPTPSRTQARSLPLSRSG